MDDAGEGAAGKSKNGSRAEDGSLGSGGGRRRGRAKDRKQVCVHFCVFR